MRLFSVFALLLTVAGAQETLFRTVYHTPSDTHVEATALFSTSPNIGYVPVRIKAVNNLNSNRTIHLRGASKENYNTKISAGCSYSIEVPAGQVVTRDLLFPVRPPHSYSSSYNSPVHVSLSGGLGETEGHLAAGSPLDSPAALLSESIHTPNASSLDAAFKSVSSGSHYGRSTFAGKFTPGLLPDNWLAYSGFDALVLTAADWSEIPAGPRSAIIAWLRQGGRLVFVAAENRPPSLPGLPDNTGLGTISTFVSATPAALNASHFVSFIRSAPTNSLAAAAANDYARSWPLAAAFGTKEFDYTLFVVVLIAFSILVGPVNLFVFAKSGRRHRLFITTPLISFGASLVMIGLIIFQDGFGGSGERRVLMEIQQGDDGHTAHIHQEQISRSGILLRPTFTVDPACLIAQVPLAKSRWARFTNDHDVSGNFDLQPVAGKLDASGSWWQSRSEQGQYLSAIVPNRGRIERGSQPGTWVSTFPFPLETIWFKDEAGKWSKASAIQTGTPFKPEPIDEKSTMTAIKREIDAFSARNAALVESAQNRKSSFIAVTNSAPAIETLKSIRWQKTRTVITGVVE
ncbi:MAG: hypothetical protein V4733_00930 [Verrucomicrobiota bacterium]